MHTFELQLLLLLRTLRMYDVAAFLFYDHHNQSRKTHIALIALAVPHELTWRHAETTKHSDRLQGQRTTIVHPQVPRVNIDA